MRITHKYLKENPDHIDWVKISTSQVLSEGFIKEFKEYVNWTYISSCQVLSEKFIQKFQDKVNWDNISSCQVLSEKFIQKFQDKVDWELISQDQKLSEGFIRKFKNKVKWNLISMYQELSEPFIREFREKVNWTYISSCQHLTSEFRKEFNLPDITPEPSREKKVEVMESYADRWNLKFDGEFLFAYRNHDKFGRGLFNRTIRYSPGNYYQDWHCNYNKHEENSFGLGIWPEGNTPVKISVDDFGIVVNRNDGKCRVKGFYVLNHMPQ